MSVVWCCTRNRRGSLRLITRAKSWDMVTLKHASHSYVNGCKLAHQMSSHWGNNAYKYSCFILYLQVTYWKQQRRTDAVGLQWIWGEINHCLIYNCVLYLFVCRPCWLLQVMFANPRYFLCLSVVGLNSEYILPGRLWCMCTHRHISHQSSNNFQTAASEACLCNPVPSVHHNITQTLRQKSLSGLPARVLVLLVTPPCTACCKWNKILFLNGTVNGQSHSE